MSLFVTTASKPSASKELLAVMLGADYSARAITPQRSDRAPNAVRQALERFAHYDARHDLDLAERWYVSDLGDAGALRTSTWDEAYDAIKSKIRQARTNGAFVISLGGDHSVSWPLIAGYVETAQARSGSGRTPRVGVIQFDVHHDVRPLDDGPSNGTPFRGLIESGVLDPDDLVQVGIHPFANQAHLARWCDQQGILRFSLDDVATLGAHETARQAIAALRGVDEIYVSVDIDVLDRASAPGTAAALPGGISPALLTAMVAEVCADPRTGALDVVEFDPERDVSNLTSYAAAFVVMTALAAKARRELPL